MIVTVIGAGASGMAAALTAAMNSENKVILLERQSRVGKKLSATGNGRCNLTNAYTDSSHYHGENPSFTEYALSRYSVKDTLNWFSSLGLYTVEQENGRYYPYSEQASSVVDVLRLAVEESQVELRTGFEVRSVKTLGDRYMIRSAEESIESDSVIVACGGLAGTGLGATLDGCRILQSLGHSCTRLYPALVQLCTDTRFVRSLKGVRCNCRVHAIQSGKMIAESVGEVQFTEYGLSGPAIFEVSRAITPKPKDCKIMLDLLPELSKERLSEMLHERISSFPERKLENMLTGLVQNRLGRTVLLASGHSLNSMCRELDEGQLTAVTDLLKSFPFAVEKTMGMENAQVTAGGVCTSGFNPKTMESLLHPGLYACGEVLDIDGDCGGFNLQWAWSSGRLAGELSGGRL